MRAPQRSRRRRARIRDGGKRAPQRGRREADPERQAGPNAPGARERRGTPRRRIPTGRSTAPLPPRPRRSVVAGGAHHHRLRHRSPACQLRCPRWARRPQGPPRPRRGLRRPRRPESSAATPWGRQQDHHSHHKAQEGPICSKEGTICSKEGTIRSKDGNILLRVPPRNIMCP